MSGVARFDVVQQRLGLGCARLGSVLGRDAAEAAELVQAAFDRGIRFFDTASIYGQGGSERILGAALRGRRRQVTIVTKAGQYFPPWMQVAKPFKQALKPLIQRAGAVKMVSKLREAPLPQNFSDRFLRASVEASLRRLSSDYADIILLHSPPDDVIENGEALGTLEEIRTAGKAIRIGVSCEDARSGLLALADERVEVVELPLWPATRTTEEFLDRAQRQGVFVIGRGLISAAVQGRNDNDRWPAARATLIESLSQRGIDRVLIGTTRIAHLDQVLDAAESAEYTQCL